MPIEIAGPSWRAPLDRRSGALLYWDVEDCLRTYRLRARTGQLGTLVRAAAGSYVDGNGVTQTAVHSQPRFTKVTYGSRKLAALALGQANGGSTEDGLSFPIGFLAQSLTLYVQGFQAMAGYGDGTPDWSLASLGSTLYGETGPGFTLADNGTANGRLKGKHYNGTTTISASANKTAGTNDLVEHRLVINANGSLTHGASINEGTEGTASDATANAIDDFGAAFAWVGNILLRRLIVFGGARSLTQCRSA